MVGGLSVAEIARAYLRPEPTVAQRIVRAKRTLAEACVSSEIPRGGELAARLLGVLAVLYLMFNEDYAATEGSHWTRPALCEEALPLGGRLAGLMPAQSEVHGLVALTELQASRLAARAYTKKQIAEKTGMHPEYIGGIVHLMDSGEERLLVGVESGRIPLTVALNIASSKTDADVQLALQEAYETGKLRGGELAHARRIVDRRRAYGPARFDGATARQEQISTNTLIRIYQREVERQRRVVRKADIAQQRLLFIVEALPQLLVDENFVNLLRAEGLETMPKQLADRVWAMGATP